MFDIHESSKGFQNPPQLLIFAYRVKPRRSRDRTNIPAHSEERRKCTVWAKILHVKVSEPAHFSHLLCLWVYRIVESVDSVVIMFYTEAVSCDDAAVVQFNTSAGVVRQIAGLCYCAQKLETYLTCTQINEACNDVLFSRQQLGKTCNLMRLVWTCTKGYARWRCCYLTIRRAHLPVLCENNKCFLTFWSSGANECSQFQGHTFSFGKNCY